jgi:hypothetical protein
MKTMVNNYKINEIKTRALTSKNFQFIINKEEIHEYIYREGDLSGGFW